MSKQQFSPAVFLAEEPLPYGFGPPDLLILNQPISNFILFSRLWGHARYRICADGGANRLYDMFDGATEAQREDYLPDCIHGDLDSLRDDVREYYTSLGVDVSQDRDVESTDFGKAMQKIAAAQPALRQREILILGTLGGRVDQGLRILHDIYRAELKNPSFRLWLLSEASVSFVLREGDNYIEGLKSGGFFTKYAGLIPIYGPATITTAGMEWDVSNWDTQMGGEHVSSSNHVVSDRVDVRTSGPILFTIERSESPRN